MDWREMAGRPTVRGMQGEDRWDAYYGAWSGGKQLGSGWEEGRWDGWTDPMRGWVIAFSWMIASFAEYVLYSPGCLPETDYIQHILFMYSHSTTAFHLGFRANTRLQSPRTHDLLLGFNTHFLVLLVRHFRMVSINSNNRGATLREERDGRRIGYISSEGRSG